MPKRIDESEHPLSSALFKNGEEVNLSTAIGLLAIVLLIFSAPLRIFSEGVERLVRGLLLVTCIIGLALGYFLGQHVGFSLMIGSNFVFLVIVIVLARNKKKDPDAQDADFAIAFIIALTCAAWFSFFNAAGVVTSFFGTMVDIFAHSKPNL
ncbi:MAG: hypothetical protein WCJ25_03610 [Candidatus Moraniibacteriota bacterium]